MDPVEALRQIAFQLERAAAPTYRVRAFRRAAQVVRDLPVGELGRRVASGTLADLPGIGPVTAAAIAQAARGERPDYLARLLGEAPPSPRTGLRAALRGDCHTHSDWSDGGSPPESAFDPESVFTACRDHGVAVEINCRPERRDPPGRLLRIAADAGCLFAINTDAHAPGQLDWLDSGCARAELAGIPPARVINARSADGLLGLTRRREAGRAGGPAC